jgi:hypothetical protein
MTTFILTGGPLGGEEVESKGWGEGEVKFFDQPVEEGQTDLPRVGYRNDPGAQCMFIGEEAQNIAQ